MTIKKTTKRKNSIRYRNRMFKYKKYKTYKMRGLNGRKTFKNSKRMMRMKRGGSETTRANYSNVLTSGSKITTLNGEDPALQSGDLSINPGLLNAFVGGGGFR